MNKQEDIVRLQERIDELEMRLAFQEDTIQVLNEQIAHQQQISEQQQQMLQLLYRQWRDMQDAAATENPAVAAQERPPHY